MYKLDLEKAEEPEIKSLHKCVEITQDLGINHLKGLEELTQGQELGLFPLAKLDNLLTHGTLGRVLKRIPPQ